MTKKIEQTVPLPECFFKTRAALGWNNTVFYAKGGHRDSERDPHATNKAMGLCVGVIGNWRALG